MKPNRSTATNYWLLTQPVGKLFIQAPLPHFHNTLPRLLSIQGQGDERQGSSPSAPPEGTTNE